MMSRWTKRWMTLVAAGSTLLPALLWAGDNWGVPETAAARTNIVSGDLANIATGRRIYEIRCADCHGQKGKGDGPAATDLNPKPGDLSKPALADQPDGVLFWKISEGKKPMPPYSTKLSEEQRWQVVNYIRTLSAQNKGK
ncbi:MAG: cytochrome c [Verrucomicrobia bacterium]|nr:cytochrome c [Verrucomicrobiota bacterium]